MLDRLKERFQRRQIEDFAEVAAAAGHHDVAAHVGKLRAAGVPWLTIAMALAPFILAMLSGQPVDWAAVIKVLMDLLSKQQAAPTA